jgi:hypothetical protein
MELIKQENIFEIEGCVAISHNIFYQFHLCEYINETNKIGCFDCCMYICFNVIYLIGMNSTKQKFYLFKINLSATGIFHLNLI